MKSHLFRFIISVFCLLFFFFVDGISSVFFKHIGKSDGLSNISVVSISQDELGRMWFGTNEGLNCYDGTSIKAYKASTVKGCDFLRNEIHSLLCDKKGSVFFISEYNLIRFDLYKERFYEIGIKATSLYSFDEDVYAINENNIFKWSREKNKFELYYEICPYKTIKCIYKEKCGRLWLGTYDGLYYIDDLSISPVCVIDDINIYSMYFDRIGNMWIATSNEGVYKVDKKMKIESNFNTSSKDVRCFIEDNDGNIWVGTYKGLDKIDTLGNVTNFQRGLFAGSLTYSSIFSLYKDHQGTIWVGTYYGGAHYFNNSTGLYRHYGEFIVDNNLDGVNYPYVGNMLEDRSGNIWICTEGGGLNCLNRKNDTFTYYLENKDKFDETFLNLKCIEYDQKDEKLYIGTHRQGAICYDIKSKVVTHYNDYKNNGFSYNEVLLYKDKIFFLSDKGLFVKYRGENVLKRPFPHIRSLNSFGVTMFIDSSDYLWVTNRHGVVKLNMNNPLHYTEYKLSQKGLGKFMITKLTEGKSGDLFLGSLGSGLYKYDREKDSFISCNLSCADYIYNISFHDSGYLVLLTDLGCVLYNPYTNEQKLLDAEKQLHLSAVNEGSGLLLTSDDKLFIGGSNGLTVLDFPALFKTSPEYNLFFSSLNINGEPISEENFSRISKVSVPFSSGLKLRHNENNFSLTFSSNNYVEQGGNIIYEYRLDGFENNWSITDNGMIVYTNIPPGKYKLKVREKSNISKNNIHSLELPIIICNPWWKTWWAYCIYLIMLTIVMYFIIREWNIRMSLKHSLEKEQFEKKKNEELVQAKLQFFANISHEFRTPLTLIISQLESILQLTGLSPLLISRLNKVYRNTHHFKDLISELLDFRKIEQGKLVLHVSHSDVLLVLRQLYDDFLYQSQIQDIKLEFNSCIKEAVCWCDLRQLRKVFSNLLSNSFKYTSQGGKIEIYVEETKDSFVFRVIDSGKGIPEESLPYIFDRFYQVDSDKMSSGSGIGLALSKSIVDLHHGQITVKSAIGYGSIFSVILHKDNVFSVEDNVVYVESEKSFDDIVPVRMLDNTEEVSTLVSDNSVTTGCNEDKDCVLIVEDNEDLIQVLMSLLSPLYRVSIAYNGKEGYEKVIEVSPDIVISDVMMPIMSGLEMCKKIKNNFEICHIPVILLTALTSDDNKMDGMKCGADDYIEKPFNSKLLLTRISNLLSNRNMLKRKYSVDINDKPADEIQAVVLNPLDAHFLKKMDEIIKRRLSDQEFDVNVLAKELAVSRTSLYNKLKALSQITPNELILNARLKYSEELLKNHPEIQITDIAYMSGFNSLRYYRHCFKAAYNITPQEYRQKEHV